MGPRIIDDIKKMSLWDVLAWHQPAVSGAILGGILFSIAFYCFMQYTMVTFLCRIFQLTLLGGMIFGFLGKFSVTPDDIHRSVDSLVDTATPVAVEAIQATYQLVTWRDFRTSGAVTSASVVIGFLGNCLSDVALVTCGILLAFSVPFIYENKKKEIDSLIEKVRTTTEGYLGKVTTKMDGATWKKD